MKVLAILAASSLALAYAQQVGQYTAEEHPPLPIQTCTKAGGCKTEQTSLVLDSAYRWLHQVGGYSPCLDNGKWNATVCPDPITCAKNCAYEGVTVADYQNNYGVTVNGDEVTLQYSAKFGARMYLMAPNSVDKYRMFKLLNQEISFDVDGSAMECGMDGGLYLISMEEDGGLSEYPTNKAGARYGTGYCDAQCPTNSFMNGQANFGATTSTGMWGQCCAEMDLWEANKISAVVTSHPSTKPGLYNCTNDVDCGNGGDNFYKSIVDKGGCGFNSYANGAKQYYGPNNTFTIDSSKKVTVITQFITDDHTANGKLVEIRRVYKQDGKVIANSKDSFGYDSITDPYCKAHDNNGPDYHLQHGGLAGMGTELGKGMVLSFTIWADSSSQHNSWLDEGNFGSCPPGSGDPAVLQTMNIDLKLSNIRVGEIGSTFDGVVPTSAPTTSPAPSTTSPVPTTTSPAPTTSSPAPTTTQPVPTTSKPAPTTTAPAGGVPKWGQCGGNGYLGPTTCKEGTCTKYNDWYSQCV